MYVVRRPFRNYGNIMVPGSIVEPSTIKRFKSRLTDGHIIEVTEQNFDKWQEVFKGRYGVTLQRIEDATVEDATVEDATVEDATVEEATVEEATVEEDPAKETPLEKPAVQKVAIKKVVAAKVKTIK